MLRVLALAVGYQDRVAEAVELPRREQQLLAVACRWVACRMEETEAPGVGDALFICHPLYSRALVMGMEESVLDCPDFRMTTPKHFSLLGLVGHRVRRGVEDVLEFVGYPAMIEEGEKRFGAGVVGLGCVVASCWMVGLAGGEVEKAVGDAVCRKVSEEVTEYGRGVVGV